MKEVLNYIGETFAIVALAVWMVVLLAVPAEKKTYTDNMISLVALACIAGALRGR